MTTMTTMTTSTIDVRQLASIYVKDDIIAYMKHPIDLGAGDDPAALNFYQKYINKEILADSEIQQVAKLGSLALQVNDRITLINIPPIITVKVASET